MSRSFATQFRKLLQQSILFILTLNFLFVGPLSYAVDLTDKEPPTLESIKIVSSGSSISDLYVLEIVTKDDKNWVSIQDKSFDFSYKDDLPVCSVNNGRIFYSTDEVSRETNSNGAKIQKFYLSFVSPNISENSNCPKFSVSKFEFRGFLDRDSNAFISILDAAGRSSRIPIISKVVESPLVLNKDFFQRFTMSNFGVWLCAKQIYGLNLTSSDMQNSVNKSIESIDQFLSLLDSYTQISGSSNLVFSRKIYDGTGRYESNNVMYTINWDQPKMRKALIQVLDDNLRLREFQNSKSLTDLLKLRVCAPSSEKERQDAVDNSFMIVLGEFHGQSAFVDEVKAQIKKAETKVAADKAAAELKARQEAEAKAAAELKAKQEAEAKAAADLKVKQEAEAKAAADLKAKQEADAKAAAELKAKQEADAKVAAELKTKQEAEAKAAAATAAATKKTTITCIKGKLIKKVTAVKPKCPTGYKVKK